MAKQRPVDAVTGLLDSLGIEYIVIGKNHAKICWQDGQTGGLLITSRTPSDNRACKNAVADMRRQLRNHGYAV